jgi:hypothetical protein
LAPADTVLYSVQSNGDDHLYTIHAGSGVATHLGLVDFGDAEGLAFDLEALFAIGGTVEELWDITVPPGALVGNTGARDGVDAGMATDPVSGMTYNVNASGGGSSLYSVNTSDGSTALVGTADTFADGLAINCDGEAFASDAIFDDGLFTIDLTDGSTTFIGGFGLGNISVQSGLAFDSEGTLWMILSNGEIYTVDPASGSASFMSQVSIDGDTAGGFEGLAAVQECAPLSKEITSGPDNDSDGEIDLVVPINVETPTQYDFTITWNGDDPVWIYDTAPAEWDVIEVEFDDTGLPLDCGEDDSFAGNYGMVDIWRGGKSGKKCNSDTSFRWMPSDSAGGVSRFYWTNGWTAGPAGGPPGTVNRINADGTGATVLATAAASGRPLFRVTDVEIDQARGALYFTNWQSGTCVNPDEAIYRTDLDGAGQIVFSTNSSSGCGASGLHRLAVDPANGDVYFARAVSYANPNEVSKVDVNGLGYTQLIGAASGWFYSGVALDNAAGDVYFGDGGVLLSPAPNGALNVMDKTGAAPGVLVPNGNGNGMGKTVAFDSNFGAAGTAFYSGWNICDIFLGPGCGGGDIYAYDVASGGLALIYSDPDSGIPDIEVDPTMQRIYWTDYVRGEIRSANYDGSDVVIEIGGLENPFGLALEIEEVNNDLNIWAEARCHDNRNNSFCRPTSCGALYLNYGAIAYLKDPDTDELVLDADGNPIEVAGPTDPLCLAAVDDVNGDGEFAWDGSGDEDGDTLSDLEEACEIGTDPCLADTDGDGVRDDVDACPLDGDEGLGVDATGCPIRSCFAVGTSSTTYSLLLAGDGTIIDGDFTVAIWDPEGGSLSGSFNPEGGVDMRATNLAPDGCVIEADWVDFLGACAAGSCNGTFTNGCGAVPVGSGPWFADVVGDCELSNPDAAPAAPVAPVESTGAVLGAAQ